jgi:hypothetical protein
MNIGKKIVFLAIIFFVLSPFFTHVWDLNTLTYSLYLFHKRENVYSYYADLTKFFQRASDLPVYYEGYTYTITPLLIFYPFYFTYFKLFNDPLPIISGIQIMHLASVVYSPNFFFYNLIIKIPLLITFLLTFCLIEKKTKQDWLILAYPLFITTILGMTEIIVGLFLLLTVIFYKRKNYFLSGAFYGIALFKFYPIILLPYFLIESYKTKAFKNFIFFILAALITNIPSIAYILQDFNSFYVSAISLQSLRLAGGITPINVIWNINDFFFNYKVTIVYSLFFISSYLLILFFLLRGKLYFEEGVLLIMLVFLLSSKVVNEQFLLSIFPLLLLLNKKEAKILSALTLIFILVRINPVYFSSPLFYNALKNYREFIRLYYNFLSSFFIDFSIKVACFTIGLAFSFALFVFILKYHKKEIRRREEFFKN